MEIKIYQVDAFTDKVFGGNPAGIVIDTENLTKDMMQNIAKEMNLSETAFASRLDKDMFKVRFFTPVSEVDLCGHATIAMFHTLAKLKIIEPIANGLKTVYQETRLGRLPVEIVFKNGEVDKIFMEQAEPKDMAGIQDLEELLKAMGLNMEDMGVLDTTIFPRIISTGLPDIMLPVKTKQVLDGLNVDLNKLSIISERLGAIGVHVFYLPKLDSTHVYTRNFAPLVGIPEEAATGTSNGALVYFLKNNNLIKGNSIISYQGEAMKRPSTIYCEIHETNEKEIIKVGGQAIITIIGKIFL